MACIGTSGEDYAVPGHNALVLETSDPQEFIALFKALRTNAAQDRAMRRAARATAKLYTWSQIVQRVLLPRLDLLSRPGDSATLRADCAADTPPTESTDPLLFPHRGIRQRGADTPRSSGSLAPLTVPASVPVVVGSAQQAG